MGEWVNEWVIKDSLNH